jgi:uncharacterized peroxidase-related enzyme
MINGFTLHDTNTAPAASGEMLNGIQKSWGFVPNLHRILAQSPAALEAYSTLWGIAEKTSFTPQERNIVYLAIIYENECTYCMAGHTNLSRMAKVEPEAISAVGEGRPIADAKLEALRQFAAKVTRQRGVVSQADVAAFKAAGYDNQSVLDVLVLAATLQLHQSSRRDPERLVHEGGRVESSRQTEARGLTTLRWAALA